VGTEYLIVPSTSHDMVDGGTDTAEGNVLSNIHEFSNRNPGTEQEFDMFEVVP